MASYLTPNFTHTWAGKEFLQELFFQPQAFGEDIFANYKVMPNIDSKQNIYIPNSLSKVLKKYTTCGFQTTGATTISDKTIDVTKVKINLEECEDAWDDTVFEQTLKQGVNRDDIRGTLIDDISKRIIQNSMRADIPRIIWMDKATSGSSDYDHFDGFFQLFFDASASLACALDMSTSSDFETAGLMSTDGALAALRQLWTDQGAIMRAVPLSEKVIMVTSSVYDNFLVTLENTGTDFGLSKVQEGTGIAFRGVRIEEMPFWDDNLADTANNPMSALIGNNAIVYTSKSNLIVGVDVTDPRAEFKTLFDEKDEVVRWISKFKLGAQYLHDELICFAF